MRSLNCVLLSFLLLSACRSRPADQPPLGTVEGTVTLDGQPLDGATVFFSPEGGGRTSAGRTDPQGHYELSYVGSEMGAKVGKHTVRMTTVEEYTDQKTGRTLHTPERVPRQYNEKTELTRDVKGEANVFDFELTGGKPPKAGGGAKK